MGDALRLSLCLARRPGLRLRFRTCSDGRPGGRASYCGARPLAVLREEGRDVIDCDTDVLKGDLTWSRVGDLQPGDTVFGGDGETHEVLSAGDPECVDNMVSVRTKHGDEVRVTSNHRVRVDSWVSGRYYTNGVALASDLAELSCDKHVSPSIPKHGPVVIPEVPQPIAPYHLACWWGDGTARRGELTGSIADRHWLSQFGEPYKLVNNYGYEYLRVSMPWLHRRLKWTGLLGDKVVPRSYVYAAHWQRVQVVRGLMDTDATVGSKGEAEFTNTNFGIVTALMTILDLEGVGYRVYRYRAKCSGVPKKMACRVGFRSEFTPFAMSRKATKFVPPSRIRRRSDSHRRIASAAPTRPGYARSLLVDGGSILLTRRLHVMGADG